MIDIGNTQTVIGLFIKGNLNTSWRVSSLYKRTEDELWITLSSFFSSSNFMPDNVDGVCISSVVPDLTVVFERMTRKYFKMEPLQVEFGLNFDMEIKYDNVHAVGADRICNAVAGKSKYGFPLIILDFGTATTFDCIDKNGDYIGGVICPGVESAASVLHHKAAKLPKIDLKIPARVIGTNTEHSMQSGIMHGSIEMINGLVEKIKSELGNAAQVIATGGLARVISDHSDKIDFVEPDLNLQGIYQIYIKNRKSSTGP